MAFPNSRPLLAWITRLHRWLYLSSGGRLGARAGGLRFLLLHHVGHRSGRHFTTPLLYVEDAGRWLVVASNAGDRRHPAWWPNLRARPDVEIQVGPERFAVRARTAAGTERASLWAKLSTAYPPYAEYQHRTEREIPVVVLERAA
jgi:deazaflavin-dependent oxidoreductase (nitroreductase family)